MATLCSLQRLAADLADDVHVRVDWVPPTDPTDQDTPLFNFDPGLPPVTPFAPLPAAYDASAYELMAPAPITEDTTMTPVAPLPAAFAQHALYDASAYELMENDDLLDRHNKLLRNLSAAVDEFMGPVLKKRFIDRCLEDEPTPRAYQC